MRRYELSRIRGQMVGDDYIVWDNANAGPVARVFHPDQFFYTDDRPLAIKSVEALNAGKQADQVFMRWKIAAAQDGGGE